MGAARKHALLERKFHRQRAPGSGLGLVPLPGSDRSVRRDQFAMAIIWIGQSIAVGDRPLFGHNRSDQNAKDSLYPDYGFAPGIHDHRYLLGRIHEDIFTGSEAGISERRSKLDSECIDYR